MEHPTNKLWAHSRRCNIHGHHGSLYICPYYGRALINKIKKERSKWKKILYGEFLQMIDYDTLKQAQSLLQSAQTKFTDGDIAWIGDKKYKYVNGKWVQQSTDIELESEDSSD